jgi:hypothetical protein
MTWIKIETEHPPISENNIYHKVLLYTTGLGVCTGYYWGQKKESDPCKGYSIMNVTHWMELPEPPVK